MTKVQEIKTLADFRRIIHSGKHIYVDFWATWCGPCRFISPIFEQLADKAEGDVEFYKVDVDEADDIAQEVGIRAMPTFIAFKDGNKVDELVGANPQALQVLVRRHQN